MRRGHRLARIGLQFRSSRQGLGLLALAVGLARMARDVTGSALRSRPVWIGVSVLGLGLSAGLAVSAAAQPASPPPAPATAQSTTQSPEPPKPGDTKPYDEKLVRLAEILGAVHYLRELCGQTDGQQWRERMREILEADGGSALRRVMLTRSFNGGYRSYGRTYQSCTPTAQTAISRFLQEGAVIADGMVKATP